jgi:phage shock protein PspC (stress-responsive transcriptional regulator)
MNARPDLVRKIAIVIVAVVAGIAAFVILMALLDTK